MTQCQLPSAWVFEVWNYGPPLSQSSEKGSMCTCLFLLNSWMPAGSLLCFWSHRHTTETIKANSAVWHNFRLYKIHKNCLSKSIYYILTQGKWENGQIPRYYCTFCKPNHKHLDCSDVISFKVTFKEPALPLPLWKPLSECQFSEPWTHELLVAFTCLFHIKHLICQAKYSILSLMTEHNPCNRYRSKSCHSKLDGCLLYGHSLMQYWKSSFKIGYW